jgi:hypothetical protein
MKDKLVNQLNIAKKVLFDIRERKRLEEERRRQEEERRRVEAELAAERKRKEEEMRQMDEEQRRIAEEEMKAAEEKRRQELREAEEQKRKELEERRMAEYLERKAAAEEARQKHIEAGGDPEDPKFTIPEPPPPLPENNYNADDFIVIAPTIGGGFSEEKGGGFSFGGGTAGGMDDYLSLVPGGSTDGQPLASADTVTGDIVDGARKFYLFYNFYIHFLDAIDVYGSSRPSPTKTRNRKIAGIFFLVVGIVLLILAGLSLKYAEDKITSELATILPIRNSNLKYFNTQESTMKFYFWDYDNLASAVAGNPLSVKQTDPVEVKKTAHWYNVSFFDNSGTKSVRFMKRSVYEFSDETAAKNAFVKVPALQYASSIGSSFPSGVSVRLRSTLSGLKSFYSVSFAQFVRGFSIPLYMKQLQSSYGANFSSAMKSWGKQESVTGVLPLTAPVPEAAVTYLIQDSSVFSLTKLSLDLSEGIGAWKSSSSKSAVVSALNTYGNGTALYETILQWITATSTSPTFESTYFTYVKSKLIDLSVIGSSDIAGVNSFSTLGLLQFAQSKLLSALSSTKYTYANQLSANSLFPTLPQSGVLELSGYIKQFQPTLVANTLSLVQTNNFFSTLTVESGDVLVSALWSSVNNGITTVNSKLASAGVTSQNMKSVASYLKSLIRFSYLKEAGFSGSVNVPPTSTSDRGLFVKASVYDILTNFADPNIKSGVTLSSLSYLPNPLLESYTSDEDHWEEHANEWTMMKTGRLNLSQAHEYFSIDGKTALRGVWKSEENVNGVRDWISAEPKHLDNPVHTYEIWDETLLRSVEYKKGSSSTLKNFQVFRYSPADTAFENQSVNPLNEKYYMSGPSGLMNLDAAVNGAPVWYSKPHFLDADASVTDAFVSGTFAPEESSHSSYVDVEPETGATFDRAERYQLNLRLSKVDWFTEPGYAGLFSANDYVYAPVFWFEEKSVIPEERATNFDQKINDVRRSGKGACAALAIFGIIFVLVGAYLVYRARKDKKAYFTSATKTPEVEVTEVAV